MRSYLIPRPETIKRLLIMNLGGIGDLLLATPAIHALRELYRQAEITIMVVPRAAEVIKRNKDIDEIVTFDYQALYRGSLISRVRVARSLFMKALLLRKKKYDLIINQVTIDRFGGMLKMWGLMALIGSRFRVGLDTGGRGFFYDIKLESEDFCTMPAIEDGLSFARLLGAKKLDRKVRYEPSEEDRKKVSLLLKNIPEGARLVGVNPGANLPTHWWPADRFASLISRLAQEKEFVFVITGTASERGLAEKVIEISGLNRSTGNEGPRIFNLAGRTELGTFAALMEKLELFVTNDTGAMHIGAAMGVKMVAIFGPGDIRRFYPSGDKEKIRVIRSGVACSPCIKENCDSLLCLTTIGVDEVFENCRILLNRK